MEWMLNDEDYDECRLPRMWMPHPSRFCSGGRNTLTMSNRQSAIGDQQSPQCLTASILPMYSVIRENFYDLAKLERAGKEMQEFQTIHAKQPGYRGNIVVDLGSGHMLIVTLWESEAQAHAARTALEPHIERLLVPLMAKPSHLLGAGQVVVNDVTVR